MIQADNFKFRQLLEESGLIMAEKYDIGTIFSCLTNERKIEIIDSWPFYLDQLLKIRNESLEKRKTNIMNALNNIDNIVNEAILRKRGNEEKNHKQFLENQDIQKNADIYNQLKRTNDLQNLIKKQYD
ncbi:MAG: hypothetical protein PHZ26_03945 [Candidatus Gracilibacteria bacterium]|nr:hypothetical protein [Candidatus Gracilibacteria bacterium]MDD2908880.1 hypothetical protein [Candidatus Gracilibacteria bacterium]